MVHLKSVQWKHVDLDSLNEKPIYDLFSRKKYLLLRKSTIPYRFIYF